MTSPNKILSCFVQSKKHPLPRTALAYALKLNEKGLDQEVVLFQESPKDITLKGLTIHCLKNLTFWKNVKALRACIRTHGSDIIHAHARDVFFVCLWAAKQEGCKFVYSVHAPADMQLARFWLSAADHLIVTTTKEYDFLTKEKKLKRVSRIPTGLDLEHVDYHAKANTREEVCAQLNVAADRFLIGNVGPLIKEEDHLTLLKVFRKLLQKNMDAELCILGKGPLREELEAFAEENGFADRFKMVEEWDNIYTFQKAMDVLIYPTFGYDRSEAILLASALSKPVIATKIVHHADVIVENETGHLVPCGFPERIDSVVMRLKATESLASDMGSRGRARVEEKFSLDSVSISCLALYQKILGRDKVAVS